MAITLVGTGVGGGDKTSGSTIVVQLPTGGQLVDDVVVLLIAVDNINGSSTGYSSVGQPTSPGAITWEPRQQRISSAGSALDGCELIVLVGKVTTAITASPAFVTVTMTGAVVAKAWRTFVARGAAPAIVSFAFTAGASGAFSVATLGTPVRQVATGDLVVGVVGVESATSITTADSDTLNGSWAALLTASSAGSGGDATKMSIGYQTKIVTAGGAQTFNGSNTVTDFVAMAIALGEGVVSPNRSAAMTAKGGGIATVAQSSARSRTQAMTGGGVALLTAPKKAAVRTQAMTGGGVVVATGVKFIPEVHTGTAALTGGGRVVIVGVKSEVVTKTYAAVLTGGGVIVSTQIKKAVRVQPMTGGGIVTVARVRGAARTVTATGGGVVVAAATSARHTALAVATDLFERTAASGWGVPTTGNAGLAWAPLVGAADFSVTGGRGLVSLGAAGTTRNIQLRSVSILDVELLMTFKTDKLAVGGKVYAQAEARWSASGYYRVPVALATAGDPNGAHSIDLTAYSVLAGTSTPITTPATIVQVPRETHVAATDYHLRVRFAGAGPTRISAKVWRASTSEPGAWDAEWTDSASHLQAAGGVGVLGFLQAGATNAPVVVSFDNFGATPHGMVPLTGGGRITYTYAAGSNRSAFVVLTGGGTITSTRVKKALRTQVMSGGGVAVIAAAAVSAPARARSYVIVV